MPLQPTSRCSNGSVEAVAAHHRIHPVAVAVSKAGRYRELKPSSALELLLDRLLLVCSWLVVVNG